MIVRKLNEIRGTNRETSANNWVSRRLLLSGDRMGFSLHDTIIHAGTSTEMHYQNHLEAVYCIQGKG
ncbi:MAG: ectoine synthase, partial [Pirellulaceae bacterium]